MRHDLIWILALTLACEIVTVGLRFGGGFESTRDTAPYLRTLTGGIRIHHGYVGAIVVAAGLASRRRWPTGARWLVIVGAALLLSDLVHHFAVLWPITGSPEFDPVYPASDIPSAQ